MEPLCHTTWPLRLITPEKNRTVTKLGDRVAPWLKIRLSGAPTISKIITAVDKLVYDDGVSLFLHFIVHLISWFVISNENYENWYSTNKNEFIIVCYI
jgi:hypothetical protein